MFNNLRNKMLWFNMATISLVMVTAFSAIYLFTYSETQRENQRRLERIPPTLSIVGDGKPDSDTMISGAVTRRIPLEYTASFVIVVDERGEFIEILSQLDISEKSYEQAMKTAWANKKGVIKFEEREWQFLVMSAPSRVIVSHDGTQVVVNSDNFHISFLDITESSQTLLRLLIILTTVGVAMLAVIFVICLYFANRSIRPIEQGWQKQKQFIADASHELKTPLAIINSNMDVIEMNGDETVASQKEWVGYIRGETVRMGKLVSDLLYLARAEKIIKDEFLPFDLSETLEVAVASIEAMIYDKKIALTIDIKKNIFISGDSEKIHQAIIILLDNAAKYTKENGKISVSLNILKRQAVVRVENTGDRISATDLLCIFDRFYRTDASRSQETGGYGLGLSIAKTIVERSGGEIAAESNDEATVFTMRFKVL